MIAKDVMLSIHTPALSVTGAAFPERTSRRSQGRDWKNRRTRTTA
jgi:hypothetical protein